MKNCSFLLFLSVLLIYGCKNGELNPNEAPETKLFLSSINLQGEQRLTTVVDINWSGSDQDGYVEYYEISIDQQEWTATTNTDSTFEFSLQEGQIEADIDLRIRAVDNLGLADPTPAELSVPVQNSKPIIEINDDVFVMDTAFILFSVLWDARDSDGDESLDSVFIKLNNSGWYAINPQINFLTIEPTDAQTIGKQQAIVSLDLQATEQTKRIDGLKLGDWNTIYMRAKDISGAYSDIDTSAQFFIKPQTSDLLLINNHGDSFTPPDEVYFPIVQQVYGNFDAVNYATDGAKNYPPFFNPTFEKYLSYYDKVFIYSDALERNSTLFLEAANGALTRYLNSDGKIMIATDIPSSIDPNSTLFQLTPMDSIKSVNKSLRIVPDSLVKPIGSYNDRELALQASRIITGVDPFYVKQNATPLYESFIFISGDEWDGPNTVCAKLENGAGQTNMVFWSVNLHVLNDREEALQNLFDKVLNEEFNW